MGNIVSAKHKTSKSNKNNEQKPTTTKQKGINSGSHIPTEAFSSKYGFSHEEISSIIQSPAAKYESSKSKNYATSQPFTYSSEIPSCYAKGSSKTQSQAEKSDSIHPKYYTTSQAFSGVSSSSSNKGWPPAEKYDPKTSKNYSMPEAFTSKYELSSSYGKGFEMTKSQVTKYEPPKSKNYTTKDYMKSHLRASSCEKKPATTKASANGYKKLGSIAHTAEEVKIFKSGLPAIGKISNEPGKYKPAIKPEKGIKMPSLVPQEEKPKYTIPPLLPPLFSPLEKTSYKTFSEAVQSKPIKPMNFAAEKDMKPKYAFPLQAYEQHQVYKKIGPNASVAQEDKVFQPAGIYQKKGTLNEPKIAVKKTNFEENKSDSFKENFAYKYEIYPTKGTKEKAIKYKEVESVDFLFEKSSKLEPFYTQFFDKTQPEAQKIEPEIVATEENILLKSETCSIEETLLDQAGELELSIELASFEEDQPETTKQLKTKSKVFDLEEGMAFKYGPYSRKDISDEEIEDEEEEEIPNDQDIIIKCGLEEMVKLFFKDYVIVWHDPNVDSEENKNHKAQLERFCEVRTFTEWEKASKYIQEAKAICHVLTSGTNGEPLVSEIWSSQSVLKIYIFCGNKDYHSAWAQNYSTKISCIEVQIQDVLNKIEQNLLEWYQEASSFRTNLPAFAPIFNNWDKSKINNLHRYLKVLPNFKNRSQAKNDFITLSKAIYSNTTNTGGIQNFESYYDEYDKEVILRWYTHESFLYKVTNNCLRIASSDSIQYCRLLLKDLEQEIKEQYQEKSKYFNGLLYRGAYLSQEEWSSLKMNLGQEVEMHGFLSVSKDREIAWEFMERDLNQKVFITIIVPKGPNEEEQGFAEVEEFSDYKDEKEILFNVRSRFTVLEVEEASSEGLAYRHLVLLYGAQGFRRFMTEKNPVQKISIPNIENISCSICSCHSISTNMFFMQTNNQNYFCKGCLLDFFASQNGPLLCVPTMNNSRAVNMKGLMMNYPRESIPMYGYKCSQCQAKMQKMYLKCTGCSSERKQVWCISCLPSLSGCMKAGHAVVLESNPFQFWCEKMSENELNHLKFQSKFVVNNDVFEQGEMFFRCHEYQKSIEYYNIYIQKNEKKGDKSQLATCYHNLGGVYESQGDYRKALKYLSKALGIRKSTLGENHADVAASYHNLGSVYSSQGEYEKGIKYHFQALKIRQLVGGDNHHDLANSFNNIALVCYNMGKYQKALKFHSNALVKRKLVYGENHPEVAGSYNNIGLVFTCQSKYKKALEYHSKALEIQKLVYGDNHPDVATSHNNIGNASMSQGEYLKALDNYSRALGIFKSVYKENHLSIAGSYNNLGLVCTSLRGYEKALEYYKKALEIRLEALHDNHPDVAISYSNIGGAYYSQGDWKKALDNLWKAKEIRISVYGENHAYTISTTKQMENIVNNCENKNNEYFVKIL